MATTAQWSAFASIPDGTRIQNNLYDQCVALANHYHQNVLGLPFVAVNSAYQWWTSYHVLPALHRYYAQSNRPVPGALFVARDGIYNSVDGHIGIVLSVNADGTFNTLEQNVGRVAPQRYTYRYRRGLADVLGFLHPYNNPASSTPVPAPRPLRKAKDMLLTWDTGGTGYLVTANGTHGLASGQVYNLFYRLINSEQIKTPFAALPQVTGGKAGKPDTFLRAEMQIIDSNLKIIARSVQTGVQIDVDKTAQALSDALGKKFNPDIEIDVNELATAFDIAAPRIAASMVKQAGVVMSK